jgi:hypothetical protein
MTTNDKTVVGELRPTQIMFSFGVGALVDLPHLSVLVMGLDDWNADQPTAREIHEERLLATVRKALGDQVLALKAPPAPPPTKTAPDPFDPLQMIGLPVATFPRWLLCPACQLLAPLSSGLFTRKDNPFHPDRTRYIHEGCGKAKAPTVVPARFLVACPAGHLDDFPWIEFVHRGPTNCKASLRLIEFGPGGEARDLMLECATCKKAQRFMSDAFGRPGEASMPLCRGRRPHLRDFDEQPCQHPVKAILLGASNLWFPDILTALSIPQGGVSRLAQLVEEQWAILSKAENEQNVALLRQFMPQLSSLMPYSPADIWAAITARQRQSSAEDEPVDLKTPEWTIFCAPERAPTTEDFRLTPVPTPAGFETVIDRVVLVEQLREVRALIGFTRIDAPGELGELGQHDRRMRISRRAPDWVPAAEVRGEGIFIQLREEEVAKWLHRDEVRAWARRFFESHVAWRNQRYITPPSANFPEMRYVLLNSLAHVLMRRLTLACGYTAASIRERLYSRNPNEEGKPPEPMAGLLIYTAAPDSEGTLGGLVSLGQPDALGIHLRAALNDARLCASDPLCAEHPPSHDGLTFHAAACHACLFAPETSCECGNRYLDRSVLVPTVERTELAFFDFLPEL